MNGLVGPSEPVMNQQADMPVHFAKVAEVYTGVRTTDEEPILYIRDRLAGRAAVVAADVGCGTGRYDLLLLRHIPGLRLACVDMSREMLTQLSSYLTANGVDGFEVINASIEEMTFDDRSLDCVLTFNAIHHFDFSAFIARAGRAVKEDGLIFVYTRTPEQNAGSIWGQHFPRFCEKEDRLYRLEEMKKWIAEAEGLRLIAAETFRYARTSSLDCLLEQARNRHYSTFSLYTGEEFEEACHGFEDSVRRHFPEPGNIEWHDENTLLQIGLVDS